MSAIEQKDADSLEAGYTTGHRVFELAGVTLAVVTFGTLVVALAGQVPLPVGWVPLAALLGILFADFTSGFVHWLCDTWGAVDTPVVGALVIRTFRHHHVDQHAITRHGFVETNGHNFTLSTLASGFGVLCLLGEGPVGFGEVFCAMSAVFAAFFVAFTSQIHKWSHEAPDRMPRAIVLLQSAGLVLSPLHHAAHHVPPYNRNYCITVGWMNGPLRAIRFFESLERAITAVTGAIPRADDIGEGAALRVASEADGTPSVTQDPAETRDLA